MVNISLSICEGPVTCRVRVRAATLRKALALAGYSRPNRVVSVHGPAPASRILAEGTLAEDSFEAGAAASTTRPAIRTTTVPAV